MDNFKPKEATEALLTALAASGDGDGMAKEVRKAGWLATRMTPMQLISAAAKEPKVHLISTKTGSTKEQRSPGGWQSGI